MEQTGHHLMFSGVVLLGFALGFVLLFRRLGLGATLGYLVAGAVVGPQVLGLVGEAEEMLVFAELGITLLLFVVGLELNPARLWRLKGEIFGLGLAQVAISGVAMTGLIYGLTSFSLEASIALGLPLGLSSTAQVLPMLRSAGRLKTPSGERAFSILLFQDISIIPLLTIIAVMSRNPADADGPTGLTLAIYTVLAIVGLILAGRFLIRPLFRLIGGMGEREMFVVAALFTVVGAAAVMEMLGLSTALGAFVAGVMLADTPYRHELEADVDPFRSILLGLFFLAVGMLLDLRVIAESPLFVFGMALALIVTKTLIILGIGTLLKMGWRSALALGLLLSQGGEFGFVLFAAAQGSLLIAPEAASLFGAVITLSMMATPFLMPLTRLFRRKAVIAAKGERAGPQAEGASALVVGYGRFGQTVTQMLYSAGITVTIVDSDVEMIDLAERLGARVYYGDGTRLDLLRQAGAGEADSIFFCMGRGRLDPDTVSAMHEAFPDAALYVRTYDRRSLLEFIDRPAVYVMRETLESAVVLARKAMENLGLAEDDIHRAEDRFRALDRERLQAQTKSGDITAANDRILTRPHRDEIVPDPG
jgi:CPA2 family monovalent cation:H+ antiporter-2/glutathione-regulated potassium-efflux system protein KefB